MQNVKIGDKMELCFLLKDGEAAQIVIPIRSLAPVDYRRLNAIEAKGGEMMAAMRDAKLDNGMNALSQYQNLLIEVPKPKQEPKQPEKDSSDESGDEGSDTEEAKPRRRGGRRSAKSEGIKTE